MLAKAFGQLSLVEFDWLRRGLALGCLQLCAKLIDGGREGVAFVLQQRHGVGSFAKVSLHRVGVVPFALGLKGGCGDVSWRQLP